MIFFFNDTATTEIYTLSLHDALPIFVVDSDQDQERLYQLVSGTRQAVPTARRLIVTHVSRFREDNQTFRHAVAAGKVRSEEHTSELQSRQYLVCRLLLEKKK